LTIFHFGKDHGRVIFILGSIITLSLTLILKGNSIIKSLIISSTCFLLPFLFYFLGYKIGIDISWIFYWVFLFISVIYVLYKYTKN